MPQHSTSGTRLEEIDLLAFSLFEHLCPGSALSRPEQIIAWEILLERLPGLRFTPGANDFAHLPGFVLRGLKALHISFGGSS
jgi:cytochrome P450